MLVTTKDAPEGTILHRFRQPFGPVGSGRVPQSAT